MSDLDRQAAEVMGEYIDWDFGDHTEPALETDDQVIIGWSPTTSPSHWWAFVQFLDEKGWRLICAGRTYIGFQHEHSQTQKFEGITEDLSTVFPATIRAGLKALNIDE